MWGLIRIRSSAKLRPGRPIGGFSLKRNFTACPPSKPPSTNNQLAGVKHHRNCGKEPCRPRIHLTSVDSCLHTLRLPRSRIPSALISPVAGLSNLKRFFHQQPPTNHAHCIVTFLRSFCAGAATHDNVRRNVRGADAS